MRHAEALLLVDDQKAEILELHRFLQQLVRTDDEVDLADREIVERFFLLLRRAEAGEDVNRDREGREAADGGEVMLLGQDGRRHQDRHLLAVQDALHRGAERDLRLAEADVAAEQSLHRGRGLHIPLDLGDAAELVVGLGVGEALFKLLLPRRIRREGEAGQALARGIELDEALGEILGRGLGAGLRLLPLVAAELVEADGRILAAGADILADKVELRGGNIERVAALIGDLDVVLDHAADLHLLHADVAADAVVLVDDEVAGREIGEGFELFAVRGGFFALGGGLLLAPGQELPLCQDGPVEIRIFEARGERTIGDQDLPLLRRFRQREGQKRVHAALAQHLFQNFAAPFAAAEDEAAIFILHIVLEVGDGGIEAAAVTRKLSGCDGQELLRRERLRVTRSQKAVEVDRAAPGELAEQRLIFRLKFAELARKRAGREQDVQRLPKFLAACPRAALQIAVVAEEDGRVLRDVVRCAGKFRINQGQIAVRCGKADAVFQLFAVGFQRFDERLIWCFAAVLPGDMRLQIGAEAGKAAGMQARQGLLRRQKKRFVTVFSAALGDGIKKAHCVQLVAEELGADGLVVRGREDIQNAAAQRKLPRALDEARAGIAGGGELFGQLVEVITAARRQADGSGVERRFRNRAELERLERRDKDGGLARREVVEDAQPPLLPFAGDARRIEKRQLARWKRHRRLAEKGRQLGSKAGGGHLVLADGDDGAARVLAERGDPVRTGDLADAGDGGGLPRVEHGAQRFIFRAAVQQGEQDVHG